MLKVMRRHAKYFYVLFFIVILSFIFWGVGSVDKPTSVPVASVGEEQISLEDFWRTYDKMSEVYREVYKEKFDEKMQKELQQKVIDSLIEERVLLVAAGQAGITVPDRELSDAIMSDPTFTRDGVFNRDIYLRTLELNRMTPTYYEALKRKEIMSSKMKRLIEESVDLSPSEMAGISNAEAADAIRQALLENKKRAAMKSYIEGIKKQMSIKINKDLISGGG